MFSEHKVVIDLTPKEEPNKRKCKRARAEESPKPCPSSFNTEEPPKPHKLPLQPCPSGFNTQIWEKMTHAMQQECAKALDTVFAARQEEQRRKVLQFLYENKHMEDRQTSRHFQQQLCDSCKKLNHSCCCYECVCNDCGDSFFHPEILSCSEARRACPQKDTDFCVRDPELDSSW